MPKKGKRGKHQRPIKGFRPGKAPPQLQKQRAKAQLGDDASWLQKQTVEAVAGRSPQEVRAMVQKWSRMLLAAAILVTLLGAFLYTVAVAAGVASHVVAAALFFLAYRMRKQGPALEQTAASLR